MRFRSCAGPCWLFAVLALCTAAVGCGADDSGSAGDAGGLDSGVPGDAGMDSGSPPDRPDTGPADDAALEDAAPPEDAAADAMTDAEDDAGTDAMMPTSLIPMHLSETGLYEDGSSTALAEGVMPYEPRYVLWSDGADKQRWLYLPEGTTIDTSNIDGFVFPVGTKAWKEFS